MTTQFESGIAAGEEGYAAGVEAARAAADRLDGEPADFCQVFCSASLAPADVLAGVRSVVGDEPALVGCVGTGVFTDRERVETGVGLGLVASDRLRFQTGVGTGLGANPQRAVRDARRDVAEAPAGHPYRSAFVLYDSLASDGEGLARRIRRKLGAQVPFSGGAASDDYALESTPVFCDDRVEHDAVALAVVDAEAPSTVVDAHGHEPISEVYEVTEADGRRLAALDGTPAFEVWRDAVRPYAREMFDVDIDAIGPGDPELLQMMGVFEFGIDQGDAHKMRACIEADPETGTMSSLVAVPEGTRVRVMRGTVDSQIESARAAARTAHDAADGAYSGAFVYDCACRDIILGDAVDTALDAMRDELAAPFVGFETYGEMAMRFDRTSGFHNSTTVVGLLPE